SEALASAPREYNGVRNRATLQARALGRKHGRFGVFANGQALWMPGRQLVGTDEKWRRMPFSAPHLHARSRAITVLGANGKSALSTRAAALCRHPRTNGSGAGRRA